MRPITSVHYLEIPLFSFPLYSDDPIRRRGRSRRSRALASLSAARSAECTRVARAAVKSPLANRRNERSRARARVTKAGASEREARRGWPDRSDGDGARPSSARARQATRGPVWGLFRTPHSQATSRTLTTHADDGTRARTSHRTFPDDDPRPRESDRGNGCPESALTLLLLPNGARLCLVTLFLPSFFFPLFLYLSLALATARRCVCTINSDSLVRIPPTSRVSSLACLHVSVCSRRRRRRRRDVPLLCASWNSGVYVCLALKVHGATRSHRELGTLLPSPPVGQRRTIVVNEYAVVTPSLFASRSRSRSYLSQVRSLLSTTLPNVSSCLSTIASEPPMNVGPSRGPRTGPRGYNRTTPPDTDTVGRGKSTTERTAERRLSRPVFARPNGRRCRVSRGAPAIGRAIVH